MDAPLRRLEAPLLESKKGYDAADKRIQAEEGATAYEKLLALEDERGIVSPPGKMFIFVTSILWGCLVWGG